MAPTLWNLVSPAVRWGLRAPLRAGLRASGQPFAQNPIALKPYVGSRRYGWTHYGVMLPDLPAPHRYFSLMVMAGVPGMAAFDIDSNGIDDPRNTAAVSVSTAADTAYYYQCTSMVHGARLDPAGLSLTFGGDTVVEGKFPSFTVRIDNKNLQAEIHIDCGDLATWFIKSWFYDHLSFVGRYRGWVCAGGVRTEIGGVGNLEYARCVGVYSFRRKPLPAHWSVPINFFTYHVVDIAEIGQVLFSGLKLEGSTIANILHVRTLSGVGNWSTIDDAFFEVLDMSSAPELAPDGKQMRLPIRVKFGVRGRLEIVAHYDCPPRFGVGNGYISGYRATVSIDRRVLETRGYSEYVNMNG